MRRRRNRNHEETEINLTPMLDVVFIMLIFFIVTSSFMKEAGIEVTPPVAASARQLDQGTIMVAIDGDGRIWIGHRNVDPRGARAEIERLHAENPRTGVVIQADRMAPTGILVEVMDAARLAGVGRISIAAQPER